MNVRVDENRFLSVACEPEERVVFDRKENKYHLLREAAARLWDEIGEGGAFDLATVTPEEENPIAQLIEAGLVSVDPDPVASGGISRRVWLARTGKASAAAIVLPLVATIATPRFVLGQDPGPSVVDLNEETEVQELEETTEETKTLTARERRRLRRQQRKEEELKELGETVDAPTVETESTSGRRRRRNRDDEPVFESPTTSTPTASTPTGNTPTSIFREEEESKDSGLNQFFGRRLGE